MREQTKRLTHEILKDTLFPLLINILSSNECMYFGNLELLFINPFALCFGAPILWYFL